MEKQSATKANPTKATKPRRYKNPKAKDTAKGDGKGMAEGSPTMIVKRRELIASARLRGATYSEIQSQLIESGFKNPSRGKPWSSGIIADDLKVVRDEWMANAAADIKEHYSRALAELEEVKKAAWAKGDHQSVLRALAQECKMFGYNAPIKVQITQQTQPGEVQPELVGMCSSPRCQLAQSQCSRSPCHGCVYHHRPDLQKARTE